MPNQFVKALAVAGVPALVWVVLGWKMAALTLLGQMFLTAPITIMVAKMTIGDPAGRGNDPAFHGVQVPCMWVAGALSYAFWHYAL